MIPVDSQQILQVGREGPGHSHLLSHTTPNEAGQANVASVGVIRIEPEEPVKDNPCPTCGGTNRLMHGYVYDDDYAHGIYFLEWCDGNHPHKAAFLTIGLGAFGDGTDASDRISFCIEWRADGMHLSDLPARDRPDLLGPFLPRESALKLANIDQLWHVADHIVLDDPRVATVETWLQHDD